MKMFKLLLLTVVLSVAPTLFAQETLEFNPRFDDDSNREIVNPNALCNKGEEPFFVFLSQFREDESFRQLRCDLTDETYGDLVAIDKEDLPEDEMFEIFEEQWLLVDEEGTPTYIPLTASWFDVEEDRVCFAEGEACEDMSIIVEFVYIFERIDGKWYLTSYLEPASDEEE